MSDTMKLWNSVCEPSLAYTQNYPPEGRKAEIVLSLVLVKMATELWGPIGDKWGYSITDERYSELKDNDSDPNTVIHVLKLKFFYPSEDNRRLEFEQYGQALMVSKNENGVVIDEHAPQKSLDMALSECLLKLGFTANSLLKDIPDFDSESQVTPITAKQGSAHAHPPLPAGPACAKVPFSSGASPAGRTSLKDDVLAKIADPSVNLAEVRKWLQSPDAMKHLTANERVLCETALRKRELRVAS